MNLNESPADHSDALTFALRELIAMMEGTGISESRIDDLIESIDADDDSAQLADAFADFCHRLIDL